MRYLALALVGIVWTGFALAQPGISRVSNDTPRAEVQPLAAPAIPSTAPVVLGVQRPSPLPGGAGVPSPAGNAPPIPVMPPVDLVQEAIDRIAPLSPAEMQRLRETLDARAASFREPREPVAKPVRRSMPLDISPSARPEVVRVAPYQGSVVSFLDAAGRPWPVKLSDNYSAQDLDMQTFGANAISIGMKRPTHRTGSVAVLLEGINTPITLSVVSNQREVDYSVEFQLPRFLPGLPAPVGSAQMHSLGAPELMDYLLGTPPQVARALSVSSTQVKAWQISPERMIVRTNAMVAAPAWSRRQSSGSGVTVYDMPLSPVVSVSIDGELSMVRIDGFAATKEAK